MHRQYLKHSFSDNKVDYKSSSRLKTEFSEPYNQEDLSTMVLRVMGDHTNRMKSMTEQKVSSYNSRIIRNRMNDDETDKNLQKLEKIAKFQNKNLFNAKDKGKISPCKAELRNIDLSKELDFTTQVISRQFHPKEEEALKFSSQILRSAESSHFSSPKSYMTFNTNKTPCFGYSGQPSLPSGSITSKRSKADNLPDAKIQEFQPIEEHSTQKNQKRSFPLMNFLILILCVALAFSFTRAEKKIKYCNNNRQTFGKEKDCVPCPEGTICQESKLVCFFPLKVYYISRKECQSGYHLLNGKCQENNNKSINKHKYLQVSLFASLLSNIVSTYQKS